MTKEKFEEGVRLAEKVLDKYLDNRNVNENDAADLAQFVINLHDHLEISSKIKQLFKGA